MVLKKEPHLSTNTNQIIKMKMMMEMAINMTMQMTMKMIKKMMKIMMNMTHCKNKYRMMKMMMMI